MVVNECFVTMVMLCEVGAAKVLVLVVVVVVAMVVAMVMMALVEVEGMVPWDVVVGTLMLVSCLVMAKVVTKHLLHYMLSKVEVVDSQKNLGLHDLLVVVAMVLADAMEVVSFA